MEDGGGACGEAYQESPSMDLDGKVVVSAAAAKNINSAPAPADSAKYYMYRYFGA